MRRYRLRQADDHGARGDDARGAWPGQRVVDEPKHAKVVTGLVDLFGGAAAAVDRLVLDDELYTNGGSYDRLVRASKGPESY